MLVYDNFVNTNQMYNVGIYARLSKEDEIVGTSESIQNQIEYIKDFIVNHGWNVSSIYIDDGYSGLNFNRPEFQRLITDIEQGKINAVVTKDLSRLGRDYIGTGHYLERYFPSKNVRYVAINDGIDTISKTSNNDMSPFKSVINDMYAKDISNKIRSSFYTKRKAGQFIGAFAPFGYIKNPNNKNHFLIDDPAAKIVKRIYTMYINGISMAEIVRQFNKEMILTPTQYKKQVQKLSYVNVNIKYYLWRQETIKRILTNPTYCGNMVQRRQEKINYKIDKFRKLPSSEWIICENTHEAIIEKKTFDIVQKMIKSKAYPSSAKKTPHLLSGLVFCGDCSMPFTFRRKEKKDNFILLCSGYSRFGECSKHTTNEEMLNKFIIEHLRKISQQVIKDDFYMQFDEIHRQSQEQKKNLSNNQHTKIKKRLEELKVIIKSLYEDKAIGIISESDFLEMSSSFHHEKETLTEKLNNLNTETTIKTADNIFNLIKSIVNYETINRTLIVQLIEKVVIFENKEIQIHYTFGNPYN